MQISRPATYRGLSEVAHLPRGPNSFSKHKCKIATPAADIQGLIAWPSFCPLDCHALPHSVLAQAQGVVQLQKAEFGVI